jgi:hypothetical protein
LLRDATFRTEEGNINVDAVKIIATEGKGKEEKKKKTVPKKRKSTNNKKE